MEHQVTRLIFDAEQTFDEFRTRYEAAVPALDVTELAGIGTWDEVLERTRKLAPHGFLRYGSVDAGPVFALAGHKARATTYLMGNHTIAERMYRHDPGAMLYAPLRTVIYEDNDGGVHFAIDQPATRFGSFGNPEMTEAGRLLDRKLAALLEVLDLSVPEMLGV